MNLAPVHTLDALGVRRWLTEATAALEARREQIDDLNVFPIADADTGTNLTLTLRAAAESVPLAGGSDAASTLREMGRSAVRSARGNSGVIVAQFLLGFADGLAACEVIDAAGLRRGLRAAANSAYDAVAEPTEGTMLTVGRAAADSAERLDASASLTEVAAAALLGARLALERTTDQLPELARAGVVDAGGLGLLVLLDALGVLISGQPSVLAFLPSLRRADPTPRIAQDPGNVEFDYEVQYLLEATEDSISLLRSQLAQLGDSVAIVGTGGGEWNVHVHVDDIGAALEAGVEAGRPHRISVLRFADQGGSRSAARSDSTRAPDDERVRGTTVIALADAGSLAHLFVSAAIDVVDPADHELLRATVRDAGATRVVLLANDEWITRAAEGVAEQARADGRDVAVLPTRSPLQALAAVAVHDRYRRPDDDLIAMAEAAAATHFGQITVATTDALTTVGPCRAGDVLGLIDGEVVEIGHAVDQSALAVLGRLLGTGGELITLVPGRGAPEGIAQLLVRHVSVRAPLTEVVVYDGGALLSPLLIGME